MIPNDFTSGSAVPAELYIHPVNHLWPTSTGYLFTRLLLSSHTRIEINKKNFSHYPYPICPKLSSFLWNGAITNPVLGGKNRRDSGPDSSPYTPQKYISNCVFCSFANSATSHHLQWHWLALPLYSAFAQQHLTWFPSFPSCPIPLCLGSLLSTE